MADILTASQYAFAQDEIRAVMQSTDDYTERIELIYYFMYERALPLSRDDIIRAIARALGLSVDVKFKQDIYLQQVKDYFIARSLGLDMKDAAGHIGITKRRLLYSFAGIGIPVDVHRRLLEAEIHADASAKYVAVQTLFEVIQERDYRAAVAFLEKRFPSQWGAKAQETKIINNINGIVTDSTVEQKALQAIEKLKKIRAEKTNVSRETLGKGK